jgi:hypothetical protein
MICHRSTAIVKSSQARHDWRKPEPITPQFRFVVRMAYACHERGIDYDLTWGQDGPTMAATITASGNIPTPKPLPKPPKIRPVATWKPAIWDAEYRLDAYDDAKLGPRPGFVIAHSCGLSLVHPNDSGELGVTASGADEDIRQNWLIAHAASGRGFGLTLNFKRAADALMLAASQAVDWTVSPDVIAASAEHRLAGNTVIAAYGSGGDKDAAKRKLADLERAA